LFHDFLDGSRSFPATAILSVLSMPLDSLLQSRIPRHPVLIVPSSVGLAHDQMLLGGLTVISGEETFNQALFVQD